MKKALCIQPEPSVRDKKILLKGLGIKKNLSVGRGGGNYSDNMGAAILRYNDGCETLLSENDLFYLLQRRKTDPFWKTVRSIRTYLHPFFSKQQYYCDITYIQSSPIYISLHERAHTLMRTYSKQSFPGCSDYISSE